MNFRWFVVILLVCMATTRATTPTEIAEGRCDCAVFDVLEKEPLIEHRLPFNVSCDRGGAERCNQLCVALALTAKDKAATLICEKLNRHVENLKIAVCSKSCRAQGWTFTGLETFEPICCHEGKDTACNATITAN